MQDGAKTLARIWEAAWRAGFGEDRAQGGKFSQGDLSRLYNTATFLPAFPLQSLTLSADDKIVPIGGTPEPSNDASAPRRRPSSSRRRSRGGKKKSASTRAKKKKRM